MNPKVNFLLVGIFIIAISVAVLIFALWLAFGYGQAENKIYLVEMKESVAGLAQDSAVKFNGVNIGSIKDIRLESADPSTVMIKIAVQEDTPITVDTRATLMSQGLTGLSYIDLKGGDEHSAPLKPAPGQEYAIIPTNPSLFLRIDASIDQLSLSLDKMSQAVNYLLRDENQKNITKILQNIAKVSETLNAQTLPSINTSLLMLQGTLPSASTLMQQLTENPSILLRGQKLSPLGPGETPHG